MFAQPYGGVDYSQVLRGPTYAWWRSALGILAALAALLVLTALVLQGLVMIVSLATGAGADPDYLRRAYAFELPSGLLAANLAVAVLAPVSWTLVAVLHRVQPRWLSSVRPGMRWRYFWVCLVLALPVFGAVPLLSALRQPGPAGPVPSEVWAFVAVILLTSPLQAAAEELMFRGYLLQALGSLVGRAWFAIGASSVIFAVLHGSQSPAMFLDRLALGAIAGILVWRTGGLEAAIAAHVVSNTVVYLNGALTESVAVVRATQGIGWSEAASDVGLFAVFAVLAGLVAVWMGLRRRSSRASTTAAAP